MNGVYLKFFVQENVRHEGRARLLQRVAGEKLEQFYIRMPVEYGVTGT